MDEKTKNTIEVLFSKYILIWIWSIQFGALTSVTFSLLNYNATDRWGTLSIALAILLALAIIMSIYSWIYIYRFLSTYIIPVFFLKKSSEEEIAEGKELSSFLLKRSIITMVFAVALRLFMGVVELIFSSLFRF